MFAVAPRQAVAALLVCGVAVGSASCGGGCGSGAGAAASAPPATTAPASSAASPGATGAPAGAAAAVLAGAPLDCERLLGAARASSALGRPLQAARPLAGPGQCVYTPGGGADDASALVDVVVACGEAAAPLARAVFARLAAGDRELSLGQKAVLVPGKGRGLVQFLVRAAPCAVEVTTVPADRAEAVAREVALSFGDGAGP